MTNDSLNNSSDELIKSKTIIRDWRIFNYPFTTNSSFGYYNESILSSPFGAVNSPFLNYTKSKEEMLTQFRTQQNWGAKKKFSVFTQYLGYAQFLGAMSLLGIHISQWYNLNNAPPSAKPTNTFNRYNFK